MIPQCGVTYLLFVLGFSGSDFFTYRIQVSGMNSSIATVAISVNEDGTGMFSSLYNNLTFFDIRRQQEKAYKNRCRLHRCRE